VWQLSLLSFALNDANQAFVIPREVEGSPPRMPIAPVDFERSREIASMAAIRNAFRSRAPVILTASVALFDGRV
jgi:hypothetical protein